MSILVDGNTRLMVQGITGGEGSSQTKRSLDYGTKIVGGVTPGRGGQEIHGVPVFDTVRACVQATGANASIIYVPAAFAADAILEAIDAELSLAVCITEGIPVMDMVMIKRALVGSKTHLIGPNCPGTITPGARCRVGIMPADVFSTGRVGVISRSGTLVYEAVAQLTALGIGQSTCVGVGGDPIIGTQPVEALRLFDHDPETDAVVLIGEIGGNAEQDSAEYIKGMSKPVIAFVAGATAPPGRRMGHAGAIIAGASGTAASKKEALAKAGATISDSPAAIGITMQRVLRERGLL